MILWDGTANVIRTKSGSFRLAPTAFSVGKTIEQNETDVKALADAFLAPRGLGFAIKIYSLSPLRYALWVSTGETVPPSQWWLGPKVA